ncbi:alpha/beta hydrolase [Mycolicibacterium sp. GF69]|uniref:alpha/beta hydrolase n=1 Tax=Mycolicibacterium sp. GF69 TaxID=2267251 RepID=UPI000DCDC8F0|nr:alpha/beta hydrolase [Mycolicibacterium sp. GF69]RAV06095.1 alpha/beta hydrolase [Mycolicibacterium sp. GF69]
MTDGLLDPVRDLEVLDTGTTTPQHPAPLLFVHGAWHAAWCWENFLDFFAQKGYRALAVSLRGHGGSAAPKRLRFCSLRNYIDDVKSVAAQLPGPPVLVGHSMGGFIVQSYLQDSDAPAAVLLASASVQGSRGFAQRLTRRYPWLVFKSMVTGTQGFNTPTVARAMFFSQTTAEADVARYAALLGNESMRVGFDTFRPIAAPERITTPVLVLGAQLDGAITAAEIEATAKAYGSAAEFFPDMGHNMMLEPGWTEVAGRIDSWLTSRGL